MKKAFTMAEILLSLTIIGVVAAITLPSLTGNINERTWNTQRKALYARFSQAISLMPALNGYGTYIEGNDSTSAVDTAAETFVTAGLSKVMKINNICDSEHIQDCGITSQYIDMAGSKHDYALTLKTWNPTFLPERMNNISIDTKAAAFETANGESILVYYNPRCIPNNNITNVYSQTFTQSFMCANFIYDLNGNKGPNTVGKDIGTITALYATSPNVVAPMPSSPTSYRQTDFAAAQKFCNTNDNNSRLTNLDELTALFYNMNLFNIIETNYWSSTVESSTLAWRLEVGHGARRIKERTDWAYVRCIQR